jgi:hypothetical protein
VSALVRPKRDLSTRFSAKPRTRMGTRWPASLPVPGLLP